jgi:hypothetical protein
MEYEKSCMVSATATDIARAQATFLANVVSKFTPESFHTLRRYLEASGDMKSLTALLLKAQRFADTGIVMAAKAITTDDFREKLGMLSVRLPDCQSLLRRVLPSAVLSKLLSLLRQEASRLFGLGKETAFHKTTTDDYVELLKDREYPFCRVASCSAPSIP